VEEGRLVEFVNAFSYLVSEHIKVQVVEALAKAGVGLTEAGKGIGLSIGFDPDDPYGTGPKPWPWPWPRALDESLRQEIRSIVHQEMTRG
jgi:hypothetical protein